VFLMLAALAGDEAVRRGWSVLRAFVAVLLCASGAAALTQWGINQFLSLEHPGHGLGQSAELRRRQRGEPKEVLSLHGHGHTP